MERRHCTGEEERYKKYADQLVAIHRMNNKKFGIGRVLHRKQLLAMRSQFEVLPNLPEYAAHGLFAKQTCSNRNLGNVTFLHLNAQEEETTMTKREVLDNGARVKNVDMKLEVIVIPVSDVERAEQFYHRLGWRQDVTPPGSGVFQFTPHGSACSIQFGKNLTTAVPGSAQRTYLIISDIEAARKALLAAGIEVSEIFHLGPNGPASGPDPQRRTYRSLASFSDPDGNSWLLQEITTRLPGRIDTGVTAFGSTTDLATALRCAEAAHGEHEKRTGQRDANWPEWYAEYMAAEQSGAELPQ